MRLEFTDRYVQLVHNQGCVQVAWQDEGTTVPEPLVDNFVSSDGTEHRIVTVYAALAETERKALYASLGGHL